MLRGHVTRYKLSSNAIATQVAKKYAAWNRLAVELGSSSCRRLQRLFKPLQVAAQGSNEVFETIANCSQRVTCLLQLAMGFSSVARQVEGKLHRVTLALDVDFLTTNSC